METWLRLSVGSLSYQGSEEDNWKPKEEKNRLIFEMLKLRFSSAFDDNNTIKVQEKNGWCQNASMGGNIRG